MDLETVGAIVGVLIAGFIVWKFYKSVTDDDDSGSGGGGTGPGGPGGNNPPSDPR
jgi:hypothetical protein